MWWTQYKMLESTGRKVKHIIEVVEIQMMQRMVANR